MEATQQKYKEDFDKRVRREPTIRVSDEVYIDCLHHAPFASDTAKELGCKKKISS